MDMYLLMTCIVGAVLFVCLVSIWESEQPMNNEARRVMVSA